ncbi:ABC transporter ATP-binding protein [Desulfotignum phosphitoxidans]|jgi:putative ABC transport system ATP-binding protein|uniref:ABC transporter ATP-binding protein n=1 Tax=Desulfotignum phosphitoxidans DSM 13687 TaxID=1286635 RepID=S0FTX0_9BACT|nr:ABC transporter ATP-binding protein [Desulfotignum phosphitoxidans]EMS78125.1 ABC transporter ATP-binding protein [Desulfotignum phosphitoxidans DSM 13687]
MIELRDIHKSYQMGPVSVEVLKGVNLSIRSGELLSIVGQSGCGKSTLMNIIGLLDSPSAGTYILDGQPVAEMNDKSLSEIRNRKIGFVFQQFNLLSKLTALQNVALPLVYRGSPERERIRAARKVLEKVGMLDREHHRPTELSGGQQQRVAIARALVGTPSIILADEPTGALDQQVGQEIMDLFVRLNQDEAITIFVITHDMSIARQCKGYVRMQDGIIHDPQAQHH